MGGVVVFEHSSGAFAVVITFDLLVEVMLVLHYHLAHPGRQRLISIVSQHVWHPSLAKVAADVTRSCQSCQFVKISACVHPPVLKVTTSRPFELVAVDLLALPTTPRRKVCCLMVIDHHSKWLSAVPLTSKRAEAVVDALKYQVLPFLINAPYSILSDNGPEFSSRSFRELMAECNIKHIFTTPNKPSSNGAVERANRTITELLRSLSTDPSSWDINLLRAVSIYNSTCHSELGVSPREFLLGRQHSSVGIPALPTSELDCWRDGNPSFKPYRVGQKVLRKVNFRGRLLPDKLAARYEGPYVVRAVNDNKVTYLLRSCETQREVKVHHAQLRPFHEPPRYIQRHPYYRQLFDEDVNDSNGSGSRSVSASGVTGFFLWSESEDLRWSGDSDVDIASSH